MKKISYWKSKIALAAAYGALVLIFRHFRIPCISIRLLGIPCPGCGMTRAITAALQLDFAAAFTYHPMFWSMPVLFLYFLFDDGLFSSKKANNFVLCLLGAGFFLQWLLKIVII